MIFELHVLLIPATIRQVHATRTNRVYLRFLLCYRYRAIVDRKRNTRIREDDTYGREDLCVLHTIVDFMNNSVSRLKMRTSHILYAKKKREKTTVVISGYYIIHYAFTRRVIFFISYTSKTIDIRENKTWTPTTFFHTRADMIKSRKTRGFYLVS